MNRIVESRSREDRTPYEKRRIQEDEEEIIRVPAFDKSDLIEKFKRTLIERMFHSDGRSVEALLKHMPKRRIWNTTSFSSIFDTEEDLLKVLQPRSCHFKRWSFSLKRWIPTIKEDFPNTLALWAEVSRIPIYYNKVEIYESIGKALGTYDKADVDGGRDKEERTTREAFFQPQRRSLEYTEKALASLENRGTDLRKEPQISNYQQNDWRNSYGSSCDLHYELVDRRESQGKNVWNILDHNSQQDIPRNRARYHPYQNTSRAGSKERYRDTASSSEWRVKELSSSRYGSQREEYGSRMDRTSPTSRASPDSQKTVSDNLRRTWSKPGYRGRPSRSPAQSRSEWLETPKTAAASASLVEKPRAPEEHPYIQTQRKNLTIANREGNETAAATLMRAKDTDNTHASMGTREKSLEDAPLIQIQSKESIRNTKGQTEKAQLTEQEKEDAELDKTIDEYADLAMIDQMLDDDNLLDEEAEIPDIEQLREENALDKEQIKAISQLSPVIPVNKTLPQTTTRTTVNNSAGTKRMHQEASEKNKKGKKESSNLQNQSKRRGARRPDIKGTAASEKLANHGRLSPKAKQLKPARATLSLARNSLKFPRHEVYPSAIRSRKPMSTSGSVVSQKPPSTQI
ncbi:hypothetical protein Bca52824_006487 [Brassica carinata]|uniref:DUF4283 domain-containing protein n=1 Tax=Brassica carinata TaxID=52824 RepID=A0A8X7W4L8_BRACI|nr:hypothetical protein Bca52824_006487 [Brassica carinata]